MARCVRLFVDHDPDNLHVIRRIEFLQHYFGIGHLRYGFWRDERNGINVLEPHANQCLQISALDVGRNLSLQAPARRRADIR